MPERSDRPATTQTGLPLAALAVLSLAVFTNITVEMLPTGLLLPMSRELDMSEGAIGLLVTIFAFTVVASSTLLIRLTRRVPRHRLVIATMVIFAVSVFGTALAATYEWAIAFRIVGALAHGVFWTVVGSYAVYLVPPELLVRAVAITTAGGSLALVLGLPLGARVRTWWWAYR